MNKLLLFFVLSRTVKESIVERIRYQDSAEIYQFFIEFFLLRCKNDANLFYAKDIMVIMGLSA